jgi:DNA-binding XRE family transcriptional regulator
VTSPLRARRLSMGLTATETAQAARVSRTYLHQLEAGRRRPSIATALRLADVLKCQVESLFCP